MTFDLRGLTKRESLTMSDRWRAGSILQGKVSQEDDDLHKGVADLRARTLQQVLGKHRWVTEEHVLSKPVAHALAMTQVDAQGIVPFIGWTPEAKSLKMNLREEDNQEC